MAHASRLQKWQGPNILNLNLTLHANVSTFWNSSPSSMNIKISCPLENHWWSLFYVTISPTTNIILKLVSLAWTSPLNSKTSVSNIKLNIFSPRMPNRHLKLSMYVPLLYLQPSLFQRLESPSPRHPAQQPWIHHRTSPFSHTVIWSLGICNCFYLQNGTRVLFLTTLTDHPLSEPIISSRGLLRQPPDPSPCFYFCHLQFIQSNLCQM